MEMVIVFLIQKRHLALDYEEEVKTQSSAQLPFFTMCREQMQRSETILMA